MKKFIFIFLLGVITPFLAGAAYLYSDGKPLSLEGNPKVFVVEDGEGLEKIADKLVGANLIRNKYSFIFYSYYLRLNKKLLSGNYRLSPSMSTQDIIVKLTKGGSHDYWLKIKDGSRVEEVAMLFPENLFFSSVDFLKKTKNLEGYLYPDSYLIPEYYNIDQILDIINKNFSDKISKAKVDSTNKMNEKDILILASLLEREGRSLESKQMIAGVILNRLNIGMPLQLDATAQYVRDSQTPKPSDYWKPVSKNDLSIESSYNTYKVKGMPPKPICSPGYNSLFSAYHPIDSDYLYYITGNDGKMYYAKTLDEHNANIQKHLK